MGKRRFRVLHLFSGMGGGARGFQQARAQLAGITGEYKLVGAVDLDGPSCADFETLTGTKATIGDIAKMTIEELRAAAGGRVPDVVFLSPPCKGFSGLLANKRLEEEKYKALNRLVLQGISLVVEAFRDALPKFILVENVPRIATRGAELLRHVRALLTEVGYRFHEGFHDCGEIGGLAQHRRRFLMIARHEPQVPELAYRPPIRRVRAIGEVLEKLPFPDDAGAGPMHILPRLELLTWVRLALVRAGGDWRDLGTRTEDKRFNNVYRVVPFDEPSVAITGGTGPTAGGVNVADPRIDGTWHGGVYGVTPWSDPSCTVTGRSAPSTGSFSVADPRTYLVSNPGLKANEGRHFSKYRVIPWEMPALTVTGSDRVGSGAPCVQDARIKGKGSRPDLLGVLPWDRPAKTVSGQASVTGSNCPAAVADPRVPDVHDELRLDPPPIIVAVDGTWHRPLTTLELLAIQSFPTTVNGRPLVLHGKSHGAWRERIGNAVPPDAAQAIGEAILDCLLAHEAGLSFRLGGTDFWVHPEMPEALTS